MTESLPLRWLLAAPVLAGVGTAALAATPAVARASTTTRVPATADRPATVDRPATMRRPATVDRPAAVEVDGRALTLAGSAVCETDQWAVTWTVTNDTDLRARLDGVAPAVAGLGPDQALPARKDDRPGVLTATQRVEGYRARATLDVDYRFVAPGQEPSERLTVRQVVTFPGGTSCASVPVPPRDADPLVAANDQPAGPPPRPDERPPAIDQAAAPPAPVPEAAPPPVGDTAPQGAPPPDPVAPQPEPRIVDVVTTSDEDGRLPVTGGQAAALAGFAGLLMLVGGLASLFTRRRRVRFEV